MAIGQMYQCEVISVSRSASIEEAAKLMKDQNVGAIVVVEDKENNANPCGILTDRDIVTRMLASDVDVHQLRVDDAMSENVLVLQQDQGVKEAIEAMREKHVRRAPVVDKSGKLVGLTSFDDLVVLLANELHELAQLVFEQVHH